METSERKRIRKLNKKGLILYEKTKDAWVKKLAKTWRRVETFFSQLAESASTLPLEQLKIMESDIVKLHTSYQSIFDDYIRLLQNGHRKPETIRNATACHFHRFQQLQNFSRYRQNRNDTGFVYDSGNTNCKKETTYSRNSNQNKTLISSKKTDLYPEASDNGPDKVCPIHKTNHSLNQCRLLKTKSLDDSRQMLKQNGICFRLCQSATQMKSSCNQQVKCGEYGDDVNVNKTYPQRDGRASIFKPCPNNLDLREKYRTEDDLELFQPNQHDYDKGSIFERTINDAKVGLSINDRESLKHMDNEI
ncbi:unnamed protein product [Mytilus edulis]|uniref:Uncharacterized protein n=1 Tax=Mytilus edulis TaxID=6550 RepID=A0A8S3RV97_MYTED|nr:unnamed protein product [Mytilus edulis]